jgi:hypothetical protein
LGSDLRAVRFDELRHEEPVISNLVGRHDAKSSVSLSLVISCR